MSGESFAIGAITRMWWEPGTTTKVGSAGYTFDASSEPYDFLAESMARHRYFAQAPTIRGTRMQHSVNRRLVKNVYQGEITKYISPAELDTILTKAIGAESPTDTWTAASGEVPYFAALFQRDSAIFSSAATSIFQYSDCKIDKLIIRGRAAQGDEAPSMITCTLRLLACDQDEIALPSNLPELGTTTPYIPYVFSDSSSAGASTITLVGAVRPVQEFIIAVDNHLQAKYINSLDPYAIRSHGRTVQLRVMLPWNDDTDDVYDSAAAGAAASIVLTNGGCSTTFNFGNLTIDDVTPTASQGPGEIRFIIDATATGGTYDLQVVNDATA